jgi:hypothetical protein
MSTATKSRTGSVAAGLVNGSSQPTTRTVATKRTKAKSKPMGRPPRETPAKRIHLSIAEAVVEQLDEAWRYHRRPDGTLARNASQLVEDLVAAYHAKNVAKMPIRRAVAS